MGVWFLDARAETIDAPMVPVPPATATFILTVWDGELQGERRVESFYIVRFVLYEASRIRANRRMT